MRTASTDFIAAATTDYARYYGKFTVGETEYTVPLTDLKVTASENGSSDLTIGNAQSSSITFSIYEDTIDLENREMVLFEGLEVSEGNIEYIQIGIFKITSATAEEGKTSYTGYDRMYSSMEMTYVSKLKYPNKDINIVKEICTQAGITFVESTMDDKTISIATAPKGYTRREMLGYLSARQGKNAVINSQGQLEFRWYKDADYTIRPTKYYENGLKFTTSKAFKVEKIVCEVATDNDSKTLTSGSGTMAINISNPFMTQAVLDAVYKKIGGFTYRPLTVECLGDWRLEVGDIVKVTSDGVEYLGELTSTTVDSLDGYVLTDRTINADKIVANSITANELDVENIFADNAVISTITSQSAFINAISTNSVVVGIKNTVDNMQVGGTNLIRRGYYLSSNSGVFIKYGENGWIDITGTYTGNSANATICDMRNITVTPNEYVLSVERTSGTNLAVNLSIYSNGSWKRNVTLPASESSVVITRAEDETLGYLSIPVTKGTTYNLKYRFKLEKGNVKTDWSPNPDDISVENIYSANTTTIDGGKITTGTITADKISVDDLSAITATIGSWSITTNKIYAGDAETGTAVMQRPTVNTKWVFAAGGKDHTNYGDCPFRVDKEGNLYSTSGTIGGFTIGADYLRTKADRRGYKFGMSSNAQPTGICSYIGKEGTDYDYVYRLGWDGSVETSKLTAGGAVFGSGRVYFEATEKAYLTKGDSIPIVFSTGGYITGGGQTVGFFLPTRLIIGASKATLSFTSSEGIRVRQGGKYCYGSTAETNVRPTSQSISLSGESGVNVQLVMSNSTNAINNDACGVTLTGTLKLS